MKVATFTIQVIRTPLKMNSNSIINFDITKKIPFIVSDLLAIVKLGIDSATFFSADFRRRHLENIQTA
ncbi:hypothetical protein T12_6879 [Trichinella patagoniensis]|uniref:Uncharacterized protein n=1 Tax=Trichinella patagoniensis TaxID=990121 RepID=A0A0V1AER4_9BILA|nr:hypothetical protein T12_6879 [Trichinella patagoniensis]